MIHTSPTLPRSFEKTFAAYTVDIHYINLRNVWGPSRQDISTNQAWKPRTVNLTAYLRAIFPQPPFLSLSSPYVNRNSRIVTTKNIHTQNTHTHTHTHTHIYIVYAYYRGITHSYVRGLAPRLVLLVNSSHWSRFDDLAISPFLGLVCWLSARLPLTIQLCITVSDLLIFDERDFPGRSVFHNERSELYNISFAKRKTRRAECNDREPIVASCDLHDVSLYNFIVRAASLAPRRRYRRNNRYRV